jgi:hypothetical protein
MTTVFKHHHHGNNTFDFVPFSPKIQVDLIHLFLLTMPRAPQAKLRAASQRDSFLENEAPPAHFQDLFSSEI